MNWNAIVLCGGKSSRMGTNKALLKLGEEQVIERIVGELQRAGVSIVLSVGRHNEYGFLGLPCIPDEYESSGPIAGIHAGLRASDSLWSLVVSCDLPFVNAAIFNYLLDQARQVELTNMLVAAQEEVIEAIVPTIAGRDQPLLAMYRRSTLQSLEEALKLRRHVVNRWVAGLNVRQIAGEELSIASGIPIELIAYNMNRPEDYEKALEYWIN